MSSAFLRHAVVYGFGNVPVYAAGFLLLPVYVRALSESEYGILDLFQRCGEILTVCLLYNGLRQALFAFHNQTEDRLAKRAAIGNILLLATVLLVSGGAVMIYCAPTISSLLGIQAVALLRIAIVAVLLETLALLLLAIAQARVESMFFVAMTFLQFALRVSLSIAFVVGLRWGARGVLLASIATSAAMIAILFARELKYGIRFNLSQLRDMTWFAIPFVPGGLGFVVLNSGDRFFLVRHVTAVELGAYALGYKLALIVKLLTRRPLYQVWSAQMYQEAKKPEAPQLFATVLRRILGAYLLVALALCLVDREVVSLLTGGRYLGAKLSIIAPVVLAYLFLSASDLMDAAFYIKRKTAWKTPVTLGVTGVMLLLYAVLIPRYGILGAAWASAAGFAVHTIITFCVTQRIMPVHYEFGKLILMLVLAIGLWSLSRLLPLELWTIPAKGVLWLLFPVLSWHLGVVTENEKTLCRSLFRSLITKVFPRLSSAIIAPPRVQSSASVNK